MTCRAYQIAMRGPDILHHAAKRLDVLHVNFPLFLFRIDDDAAAVIRIVS